MTTRIPCPACRGACYLTAEGAPDDPHLPAVPAMARTPGPPTTLEGTMAEDPIAVAARVAKDADTLYRMADAGLLPGRVNAHVASLYGVSGRLLDRLNIERDGAAKGSV